jgi:hypothetical protein
MFTVIGHFFLTLDVFNFALSNQDESKVDFAKVLEDNMRATQSMVTKLAEMGGDSGFRIGQEDAFGQCQKVTFEVRGLRTCIIGTFFFDYS